MPINTLFINTSNTIMKPFFLLRKYTSPLLLILKSFSLPPLECCFGTRPSQADNCLPFLKQLALPMLAINAVAVIKPIPGMPINCLYVSYCFAISISRFSSSLILVLLSISSSFMFDNLCRLIFHY